MLVCHPQRTSTPEERCLHGAGTVLTPRSHTPVGILSILRSSKLRESSQPCGICDQGWIRPPIQGCHHRRLGVMVHHGRVVGTTS